MTPRLSAVECARQTARLVYGDLTPFLDTQGFLTCSPHDLPPAAAAQIEQIEVITTAAGTRTKVRAGSAAPKRRLLKLVEQLEHHHPDPAVRNGVRDERLAAARGTRQIANATGGTP